MWCARVQEIGSKDNIEACLARAKDKKDPFRLMGFGHRVYKVTYRKCAPCDGAP